MLPLRWLPLSVRAPAPNLRRNVATTTAPFNTDTRPGRITIVLDLQMCPNNKRFQNAIGSRTRPLATGLAGTSRKRPIHECAWRPQLWNAEWPNKRALHSTPSADRMQAENNFNAGEQTHPELNRIEQMPPHVAKSTCECVRAFCGRLRALFSQNGRTESINDPLGKHMRNTGDTPVGTQIQIYKLASNNKMAPLKPVPQTAAMSQKKLISRPSCRRRNCDGEPFAGPWTRLGAHRNSKTGLFDNRRSTITRVTPDNSSARGLANRMADTPFHRTTAGWAETPRQLPGQSGFADCV